MLDGMETVPAFPPLTGLQRLMVPEVSNFPGLGPAVPKEGNGRIQGQDLSFRSLMQGGPTGHCSDPASALGIHSLSDTLTVPTLQCSSKWISWMNQLLSMTPFGRPAGDHVCAVGF